LLILPLMMEDQNVDPMLECRALPPQAAGKIIAGAAGSIANEPPRLPAKVTHQGAH